MDSNIKKSNPFTLTFGMEPDSLISRYEDTDRVINSFNRTNISRTYLIEGIRGSGKTVLMTTIANELQKDKDWIIVNLNPAYDLIDDFAKRLNDKCETIPNFFSSGLNVSVGGIGVGFGGNTEIRDNISIIKNILEKLNKRGKKILITIDEVMNDKNMKVFASQFQIFIREGFPIYLIMTGLKENIIEIQNNPALTFLLRSPKIEISPLSIIQITRKYASIFEINEEKAKEMAISTKGYAFAFQLIGLLFWDNRDKSLDEILYKCDEYLDDFVYKKIWLSCSPVERKFLLSIKHDNTSTKEICNNAGINLNSYSQYRDKLREKGIIDTSIHGYISLALPRFYEVVSKY